MNSYKNPAAIWLGSPNFTPGRNGHDMTAPSWVVLHTMVGSESAANSRFQQASEQASATYGVRLDGSVVQWVDEADAAWANGATGRGGIGDNLDSISIEHEDNGDYNGPRTPELHAASAALIRDICTRYGVPIDRQHIIGHRECDFASTACPDALDVDGIVAMAAAGGFSVTSASQIDALYKTITTSALPQSQTVLDVLSHTRDGVDAANSLLAALAHEQGVEKAAIDALAANTAAAGSVAALAVKLDAVLAGLPPAVSTGLQAELDAVNAELKSLCTHLGVGSA